MCIRIYNIIIVYDMNVVCVCLCVQKGGRSTWVGDGRRCELCMRGWRCWRTVCAGGAEVETECEREESKNY